MLTSSHGCGFILFTRLLVWWERNKGSDRFHIVSVVLNFCLLLIVSCFHIGGQMRWRGFKTGRAGETGNGIQIKNNFPILCPPPLLKPKLHPCLLQKTWHALNPMKVVLNFVSHLRIKPVRVGYKLHYSKSRFFTMDLFLEVRIDNFSFFSHNSVLTLDYVYTNPCKWAVTIETVMYEHIRGH